MRYPRCPGNAPGAFYVIHNQCISCEVPVAEAPELMDFHGEPGFDYHCRFYRQPATEAELDHAINAVRFGCCGAVRYGGNDKEILDRIGDRSVCDVLWRRGDATAG